MGSFLGGNVDGYAGLRVSANSSGPVNDMEGAEAPYLDPLAAHESFRDRIQDDLDGFGRVSVGEVIFRCQGLDEFGTVHDCLLAKVSIFASLILLSQWLFRVI